LLVALLDADDQWYPDKIRRQVTVLGSRPDCCLVYTARQFWDNWLVEPATRNFDLL